MAFCCQNALGLFPVLFVMSVVIFHPPMSIHLPWKTDGQHASQSEKQPVNVLGVLINCPVYTMADSRQAVLWLWRIMQVVNVK